MGEFTIMDFFKYDHLPEKLQEISKPFGELAKKVNEMDTNYPAEKQTALRKILEAKDAAVRAALHLK